MPPICLVTDSTVQFCTPAFAQNHALTIAPLTIHLGAQTYQEGRDLTTAELFSWCAQNRRAAAPAPLQVEPPSSEYFAALYNDLSRVTDKIISIHASGQLSPLVRHAQAGSEAVRGRCKIEVVDSRSISAGLGALVEVAAAAVAAGASFEETVRVVRSAIPRLYSVFFVKTLRYLAQAGKANPAQALLAEMLAINPFLTLEEGDLAPMEKTRTRSQAIEKVVEFVAEFTDLKHLAILHGANQSAADAHQVREQLALVFPQQPDWPLLTYNPSLALLLGPEALGVMVCEAEPSELE